MPITPEEAVDQWDRIIANFRKGAKATTDAMAAFLVWRAREITLRRFTHPPGAWHRARPGEPPAYGSGNLARAMFYKPASSGLRTTAVVGNKAHYSRIAEFGCAVYPVFKQRMSWMDSGGNWFHEHLDVPAHPFLRPTVEESIDDGSLRDVAIEAFRPYDP